MPTQFPWWCFILVHWAACHHLVEGVATATGNCHDYPCWNLPYYLKESQVKKQTRHHYQQHQWCHTHPVLAAGSLKGQHLTGYLRGYCGMIFGCHLGVVLRARLILSQPLQWKQKIKILEICKTRLFWN